MTRVMMREEDFGPKPEISVDTKLELMRHMSKLHSDISEELSDDLVYAKLGDKDKKYVIEASVNAYYGFKLFQVIKETSTRWTWNKKLKRWEKKYLSDQQKVIIDTNAKHLLNSFMKRVKLILGVNRNVKNNYIIRILAGLHEEDESNRDDEIDNLKDRVIENLTPKQQGDM